MASHQPILPSLAPINSTCDPVKPALAATEYSSNRINGKAVVQQPGHKAETNPDGFIGYLEVFIHHAREIQNICIYHKQDVYAKLFLTNHPDTIVSTKTINGGGQNPVFNEKLRLDVRTVESSLKCEIYMLSRVKNYLHDQLLGVALIPLPEVLMANGTLEQEFSLSSTDLYHSPSGFIRLSLTYVGSSPEVIAIPTPIATGAAQPASENDEPIPSKYEKIEFPDLNIVEENNQMVSEYFGIPCADLDSQASESLITSENGNGPEDEVGIRVVESFAQESVVNQEDSVNSVMRKDTPTSSVSTNGTTASIPAASHTSSYQSSVVLASPSKKDKRPDVGESEVDSSDKSADNTLVPPLIKLNLEPEQTVKQEDIVEMYMKSMQQFTESLAKMKLPLDIESNGNNSEDANTGSTQKEETPKSTGSRVFYGSRAFF